MKDFTELRKLTQESTLNQVKVLLLILSLASGTGVYLFGAPPLMVAFFAGFWLLPLLGMKGILRDVNLAVEAYDSNRTVGVQVKWIEYSESESNTYGAEFDLGAQGKWLIHLSGAVRPFEKHKKDLPAVVTVWLHPISNEPRVLKSEAGYFYAKQVEQLLQ